MPAWFRWCGSRMGNPRTHDIQAHDSHRESQHKGGAELRQQIGTFSVPNPMQQRRQESDEKGQCPPAHHRKSHGAGEKTEKMFEGDVLTVSLSSLPLRKE